MPAQTVRITLMATCVTALMAATASAAMLTVEAAQDNYVRGTSAADNAYYADLVQGSSGTDSTLVHRRAGNMGYTRKIWMRFDLSSVAEDPSQPATFSIVFTGPSSPTGMSNGTWPINVYGLNDGYTPGGAELGSAWLESEITWNNAPGNNTSSITGMNPAKTSLIGSFNIVKSTSNPSLTTPNNTTFQVVIPVLADYLQADGSVTLMIASPNDAGSTTLDFVSSEHATQNGPQLEVTLIPEPGSLALAAPGGLFLLSRRRKRAAAGVV